VHTGTHVDAPVHFLENGKAIEDLPLKTLIGRAYVVELAKAKVLDEATLEAAGIPPRTRRVLFKTRNSELWAQGRKSFYEDYVALDATGARWLASKGFHLVGIDYLSIAHYREPVEPHQILLSEGVVLLEGLNLDQVSQGRYTLYCLPMKILGSDGAPARAILAGV
jgi:arylformamidase